MLACAKRKANSREAIMIRLAYKMLLAENNAVLIVDTEETSKPIRRAVLAAAYAANDGATRQQRRLEKSLG